MEVGTWLHEIGLGQYEALLRDNAVDFEVLPDLTEADLQQIGIPLGHRKRLLRAIGLLAGTLPPAPVDQPAISPKPPTPVAAPQRREDAERRPITVMFCDLAGSTRLAATLDAEDWRDLVGTYLDEASKAVSQFGGHVLKKLGDGLMALFGYPVAQENDAERAARAGLAILRALDDLNAKSVARGFPALAVRVGLESGSVVVDATGEVFGDAPNVAARVQTAAEPGTLFITEAVQRQVAGLFVAEDRGPHELKGVAGKPKLYRLVRASGGGRRSGARSVTPLVGREEELATLDRRWERAKAGDGQFVQIVGEPGLGKTRLTEELHARVMAAPHTWVAWSSSQLLQNSPLHPIKEWGRQRFGGSEVALDLRLGELEATLAQVKLAPAEHVPLLAPLLDIPLPETRAPKLAPEELRRKQLAAIVAWLLASARQQPIVLIFEDLHWADPTTLDLLKSLAERGVQAPLLIVATARPEFRAPWAMRSHHSVISLSPLDRAGITRMVASLAERHALPREAVAGVADRTGGVPLFVEEVTRLLLEGGAQTIPPTLQQSLAARLDRLGEARDVAQIGAVLGREFSYSFLQAVADRSSSELDAALEKLTEADLLFVEGVGHASLYRFKHALIQDAAYESMLKARRQALHRRAAEALLDAKNTQPELVAHHFTQSNQNDLAIEWWGKAGDAALKRSAFQEAISHLGKAIELSDSAGGMTKSRSPGAAAQRMKLQTGYGQATMMVSGFASDQTKAAFVRAAELSARTGDFTERFAAAHGQWTLSLVRGELSSARSLASAFLKEAEDAACLVEAGVARRGLALACLLAADLVEARMHCHEALALSTPEHDKETRERFNEDTGTLALSCLAMIMWEWGEVDRARELIEAANRRGRELDHPASLAHPLQWLSFLNLRRRDFAAMLESAQALIDLARKHAMPFWTATGEMLAAAARGHLGDAAGGAEELRRAQRAAADQGMTGGGWIMIALLGELEAETLGVESALKRIDEAEAIADRVEVRISLPRLHQLRGELLLKRRPSDAAGAEKSWHTAVEIAARQGARSWGLCASLSLARLLQSGHRPLEAYDALAPALEGFTRTPELPEIGEALELLKELERAEPVKAEMARRSRDHALRTGYAQAIMAVKGYAATETRVAYERVRGQAADLSPDHWANLNGEWASLLFQADLAGAANIARTFVRDAEAAGLAVEAATGKRLLGLALVSMGDVLKGSATLEEAVSAYSDEWPPSSPAYGDFLCDTWSLSAIPLWQMGQVDLAAERLRQSIARATEIGHGLSLATALGNRLQFRAMTNRPGLVEIDALRLRDHTEAHGIGLWGAVAEIHVCWASCRRGDSESLGRLRRAVRAYDELGGQMLRGEHLVMLAECEIASGAPELAIAAVEKGREVVAQTGLANLNSALQRVRGDALASRDPAAAEAAYREAVAAAEQCGARTFALIAALRLAHLLQAALRPLEAQEILIPALRGFAPTTEFPAIAEAEATVVELTKFS